MNRVPFDPERHLHREGAEAVLRADPALVAAVFADPATHALWGVRPEPYEDRGIEGMRCLVRGPLVGSVEWWLAPLHSGTPGVQAHFYLRVAATWDGDHRPWPPGRVARRLTRLRTAEVLRRWREWAATAKELMERPSPVRDRRPSARVHRPVSITRDILQSTAPHASDRPDHPDPDRP